MQKDDSKGQAGTKADSEQKDQDLSVSQHSRKPHVIGFASTVAPNVDDQLIQQSLPVIIRSVKKSTF